MGEVIDSLPEGQDLLVTSLTGKPLTALRASQIIRDLKIRHNKKVDDGLLKVRIRDELRPYDMRGTAATALLRAGCSLNEIAVTTRRVKSTVAARVDRGHGKRSAGQRWRRCVRRSLQADIHEAV
ncbi:hypothetical protein [Sedimentitalea xiamensis]